jgi:GLPGLI family protein
MHTIIRTLALAAGSSFICAQSQAQDKTQGQIHYELTYNIHASMKPDQLQYKDLVPETVVEKAELIYKGQRMKSFFADAVEKEDEGVNTSIRVSTDDGNERYTNVDDRKIWWVDNKKNPPVLVEKALITKPEEKIKESDETRIILGYTCKKRVVSAKKEDTFIVWYTTELPLKAGTPFGGFTGDGVVLVMESKRVSFKATGIDFVPVADKDVTPPADIKIVKTQEQSAK